jgi:predicted nuclease of predicted toxin-antitoxin system
VRFYLDEDLSPQIAVALRGRGIDAASAHEVGNQGLTDREQLAFAARHRRCLVTGNARDFVPLAKQAVLNGDPLAGIVLCPSRPHAADVGAIARALIRLVERFPRGIGEYDLIYL